MTTFERVSRTCMATVAWLNAVGLIWGWLLDVFPEKTTWVHLLIAGFLFGLFILAAEPPQITANKTSTDGS